MAVYNRYYNNPYDHTILADSDGFGAPRPGGVMNVKFAPISYTQEGVDVYVGTLPKGAEIVGWVLNVTTAFNDSGTDLLDIGDATTGNRFANDISLATAGQVVTGFDPDELFTELTGDTGILARYTGQNDNASAGAATIAVYYIIR
jgi:hypothetical protein